MLSAQTIAVVKQTVPVLVTHGETLTRHFYNRMFTAQPAVKSFFNPAHQHTGGQQRALAAAICAYAQNIEQPQVLGAAIELIAQKHVSLGVKPEHYPIVGEHLLGSIREVLGAACTEEIINAWAEAYGFLADVLIKREAELYAAQEQEHGWSGFEPFVVERKERESSVITSFYLKSKNGRAARRFLPGQYITVRVPDGNGGTTMRNYSLSCAPGKSEYRISVKRELAPVADAPAGHVSNYLHNQVNVGDTIEVGPPCGEFTLDPTKQDSRPLVLISAGVGITPVLSMLHAVSEKPTSRDVRLIHGALNGQTHAFRQEVKAIAEKHPSIQVHYRYSNPTAEDHEQKQYDSQGMIDHDLLRTVVPHPESAFYICGPKPFMACVQRQLLDLGVSAENIRCEFFGPAQALN